MSSRDSVHSRRNHTGNGAPSSTVRPTSPRMNHPTSIRVSYNSHGPARPIDDGEQADPTECGLAVVEEPMSSRLIVPLRSRSLHESTKTSSPEGEEAEYVRSRAAKSVPTARRDLKSSGFRPSKVPSGGRDRLFRPPFVNPAVEGWRGPSAKRTCAERHCGSVRLAHDGRWPERTPFGPANAVTPRTS